MAINKRCSNLKIVLKTNYNMITGKFQENSKDIFMHSQSENLKLSCLKKIIINGKNG